MVWMPVAGGFNTQCLVHSALDHFTQKKQASTRKRSKKKTQADTFVNEPPQKKNQDVTIRLSSRTD